MRRSKHQSHHNDHNVIQDRHIYDKGSNAETEVAPMDAGDLSEQLKVCRA